MSCSAKQVVLTSESTSRVKRFFIQLPTGIFIVNLKSWMQTTIVFSFNTLHSSAKKIERLIPTATPPPQQRILTFFKVIFLRRASFHMFAYWIMVRKNIKKKMKRIIRNQCSFVHSALLSAPWTFIFFAEAVTRDF